MDCSLPGSSVLGIFQARILEWVAICYSRRTVPKKSLNDSDNHDGVVTNQSQTSWRVKSSGPKEALLQKKLVEMMEFQLSYLKSFKMMPF